MTTPLTEIYGSAPGVLLPQVERFHALRHRFEELFGRGETFLFSSPGRTELGGNHTDHNHGSVLAASVCLDTIAAVRPTAERVITLRSGGYPEPFIIGLDRLAPLPGETGSSAALIRGVAASLSDLGYRVGGFHATVASDVAVGSGLSSSASFEVLLGTILNSLYNEGAIAPSVVAQAGRHAENDYFGKPCGLMDQLTCAVGGALTIDFTDPDSPQVDPVPFDPEEAGFRLLVVDTGGSHADLTEQYAAIPREMRSIADLFGGTVCRDISARTLLQHVERVRREAGDRSFLRALHFLDEQDRVAQQAEALRTREFDTFLKLVSESGKSSFALLQNCFSPNDPLHQGVAVALALTDRYVRETGKGVSRVHGGGFAGTIQVYLPLPAVPEYERMMERAFGKPCVTPLKIRHQGAMQVVLP